MGYYCTVPQCTSLAGKTKNVKFHRFPRDDIMAEKWNVILKRGKPYTKYSKVCSLHFTQADYNVTTMGGRLLCTGCCLDGYHRGAYFCRQAVLCQWKTLSKDAVPSQNLPKLNPDGTVMVIRKSRTVKYKEPKKDDSTSDKDRWTTMTTAATSPDKPPVTESQNFILAYRLQGLNTIAQNVSPAPVPTEKPKKQDAIMQTDPLTDDETPINFDTDKFDVYPNDYMKNKEYIPQTNEEYNKEAEKYALERKTFEKNVEFQKSTFEKDVEFQKSNIDFQKCFEKTVAFQKSNQEYQKEGGEDFQKSNAFDKDAELQKGFEKDNMEFQKGHYGYYYQNSAEMLRNQQQNLQLLQEQHRVTENQNFFDENHIKQEIEFTTEEDNFGYDRSKERVDQSAMFDDQRRLVEQQRLMEEMSQTVKQEPEATNNNGNEIMHSQSSPYFAADGHNNVTESVYGRPGPELLIAKQNALAAHTQLWQNTMKRPFFYSENNHYNAPQLLHRYEDITRILQ